VIVSQIATDGEYLRSLMNIVDEREGVAALSCVSDEEFMYAHHQSGGLKDVHFAEVFPQIIEFFRLRNFSVTPSGVHLAIASRAVTYRFSDLFSAIQGLRIIAVLRDPISFTLSSHLQKGSLDSGESPFGPDFFHALNNECSGYHSLARNVRAVPSKYSHDALMIQAEMLDNGTTRLSLMKEILAFLFRVESDDLRIETQVELVTPALLSAQSEITNTHILSHIGKTRDVLENLKKHLMVNENLVEDDECRKHLLQRLSVDLSAI
jgi:hypothetical protein